MTVGRRFVKLVAGLTILVASTLPAGMAAQETRADSAELAELRRRIEALSRELERVRLGAEVAPRADTGVPGFGPAASKVYRGGEGVSVGGYGEVLYENFADTREDGTPSGAADRLDALRLIAYLGYKFDDRWLFNSEIEFEHGSTEQAGAASVEFAYLDFRPSESFGVRGGLLLMPMGFLNELHEPPVFLGTERPLTESLIIPSTWRETGLGVFGSTPRFSYRAYLTTALDAVGGAASAAGGFTAEEGLREGRQNGSKATAESFALTGRLDYVGTLGLTVGTSVYFGNAGQGRTLASGETVDAGTFIWEGHGQYRAHGFDLRALVAVATVSDVTGLNELLQLTGSSSVGEKLVGWYAQAGYDVLRWTAAGQQLVPYVRFEEVNTQEDVPDGFSAAPANDRRIVSLGAAWKPIPNIILKSDYQIHSNRADTGVNQLNVALGYLF